MGIRTSLSIICTNTAECQGEVVRGWTWYVFHQTTITARHLLGYHLEYFEAVADAILSAKSEIYIEDWWLVSISFHVFTMTHYSSFLHLCFTKTRVRNWYVKDMYDGLSMY